MKKILLVLALISASQTIPFSIGIGGGPYYGGYYGGPYGGYGYGPGYWGPGYGYGGVAFASRPKSSEEIQADKEVREAREETRDNENKRKAIRRQIKDLDRDVRLARKKEDFESVKMLEKQQADLRKELANI